MSEDIQGRFDEDIEFGRKYLKKYWKYIPFMIVGAIAAIIIALFVFLNYIQTSSIGGRGTWTFDQWSIDTMGSFIVRIVFWEFLFVIIPFGAGFGICFYLLWKKVMTEEERQEIKERDQKEKERRKRYKQWGTFGGGGGVIQFMLLIISLIIIWVDGNIYIPFGSLSYSYFIYVALWAAFWALIIFGIPLAVVGIIFLKKELEK
ncbi:MAG: hypothetical protein EAX96_11030 [Candidatus Lokiarchaeota archaeon]|nr:hypothetical protein [Candidatus Lokiarchaeota archaeon]